MEIKQAIIIISSALFIVGCGGGGVGTETGAVSDTTSSQNTNSEIITSNPYPAPYLSDEDKTTYLKVINDARSVRQNCGAKGTFDPVPALKWSEELYNAAAEHSEDMVTSDTFQHDGSGTDSDWTGMDIGKASTVQNRLDNNKYSGWTRYGENIAAGTERDTAQKAIDAWLKSDSHCAILMDPNFTEVGMAHAENIHAHYTHYWTQNFGSR